jgi:hypothetical protein
MNSRAEFYQKRSEEPLEQVFGLTGSGPAPNINHAEGKRNSLAQTVSFVYVDYYGMDRSDFGTIDLS